MTWKIIIALMSLSGVIIWWAWAYKDRKHWLYSVAPITYFLHVLILYLFVMFGNLSNRFINDWSNTVRIHGLILLIGLGVILLLRRIKWTS